MHAFLTYLTQTIAIVRVGEQAIKWGDPYEYAAVVVFREDKNAEVIALVSPDKMFSKNHGKAIIKLLHGLGYAVFFERVKPNEVRPSYRLSDDEVGESIQGLQRPRYRLEQSFGPGHERSWTSPERKVETDGLGGSSTPRQDGDAPAPDLCQDGS